jgi:para-nitrobenzyl esterase
MIRVRAWLVLPLALVSFACAGRGRAPETPPPSADAASRRTLASGDVVGFQSAYQAHAWLGIPFAAPPTGDLRWRAPQPPARWGGVRESLVAGSPCPQFASRLVSEIAEPGSLIGDEDCLYLNVYAPRFAPGEVPSGKARLPVMLWIHGGGNTIGHAAYYNGGNLAATHRVVVVTTNYRLGAFGWFRHPALAATAADALDASGNYGTLDLVQALKWVRENASAFGGDPANVTIFGESAGGANVVTLLVSPLGRGLFHRAVVQSGGTRSTTLAQASNLTDDPQPGERTSASEIALRLLVAEVRAADREAARAVAAAMAPADLARWLRGKSTAEILSAYEPGGLAMYRAPNLLRDGTVLPAEEIQPRLERGEFARVPVIFGTNRDETKLFQFMDPRQVRRWLWIFPRARDLERYELSAEYNSKMWKANGADEPAAAMRAAGHAPVYVYRWDWDAWPKSIFADLPVLLGAAHGLEIGFVFGHFSTGRLSRFLYDEDNADSRAEMSRAMMSYWANFAYEGDPGRGRDGSLPRWGAWDDSSPAAPKFLVLDAPDGGGIRASSEALTRAGVVAAVELDPRLPDWKRKCEQLAEFVRFGRSLTLEEYAAANGGACGPYPGDDVATVD